jgi:amino acid adenylation domain-containing protein
MFAKRMSSTNTVAVDPAWLHDDPQKPYPRYCGHELFEKQVLRVPDQVALIHGNERISYRKLSHLSDRLASDLRQRKVGKGDFVGLHLRSSVEAIVGVLGIFKSGAAAVPLDPDYPRTRLKVMIDDSRPRLILTSSDCKTDFPIHTACIDTRDPEDSLSDHPSNSFERTDLDSPAFVLYTSGSTGRPKGVLRPHRAIVSRLAWSAFSPDDVLCHNMSLSVGFSQERLFLPLMHGLPLAVISEQEYRDIFRFSQALQRTGVTQVTLVPDVLRQLLDCCEQDSRRLHNIRVVAVGSAPLKRDLVESFIRVLPHAQLVNAYGSTESGSVIRGLVRQPIKSTEAPIGLPVATAKARILDANMNSVPHGTAGDLYVGGPSIAMGYVNLPERTAERFVPDPFGTSPEDLLYKTGDIARQLADGAIQLHGRADRQVKVRGTRVELGEVEAIVAEHESVREVVVNVSEDGERNRLIAYVVWKSGLNSDVSALEKHCRSRLPTIMIPVFVVMDSLPRNLNGKVDVSALPSWESAADSVAGEDAPKTQTEHRLAEIWQETLGKKSIGTSETFFGLGGDSLSAMQMLTRVWKAFDRRVPLARLLGKSGLREFAAVIDEEVAAGLHDSADVIPLFQPTRAQRPSLLQQERLSFELWADSHSVPHTQSRIRFALELEGPLNAKVLERALNEIVQRHSALRTAFRNRGWQNPESIECTTHQNIRVRLDRIDIENMTAGRQEKEIRKCFDRLSAPLDYTSIPLLRVALIRLSAERHRVLAVVSHLIADAWSMNVLQLELSALYEAFSKRLPSPLTPLAIQYVDFAEWQRQQLTPSRVQEFAEEWTPHVLAFGEFDITDLRSANADRTNFGLAADSRRLEIGFGLREELTTFAIEKHCTFYMTVLATFCLLLRFYSSNETIALMVHFANRRHPDTQNLIGWLANSFPVGFRCSTEGSVNTVLDQVREIVLKIEEHQELPFPMVARRVSRLLKDRGASPPAPTPHPPLPKISFEFLPASTISGAKLKLTRVPSPATVSEWGLRVIAREHEQKTTIEAIYNKSMFKQSAIQNMLADFDLLLRRMPSSRDRAISNVFLDLRKSRRNDHDKR